MRIPNIATITPNEKNTLKGAGRVEKNATGSMPTENVVMLQVNAARKFVLVLRLLRIENKSLTSLRDFVLSLLSNMSFTLYSIKALRESASAMSSVLLPSIKLEKFVIDTADKPRRAVHIIVRDVKLTRSAERTITRPVIVPSANPAMNSSICSLLVSKFFQCLLSLIPSFVRVKTSLVKATTFSDAISVRASSRSAGSMAVLRAKYLSIL